jgi:FSR family fosmidomycin resistance protein-like MFS transporter
MSAEKQEPFVNKALVLLSASHLVTDLASGALPVMLPFLKTAFDLTYAQIGVVVMAQNLTSSVIQPLFGYLADRRSLPWLIPAGALLGGIGLAVSGLVSSYYLLLATVIISGLGVAAFHPQGSKSAHFASAKSRRGQSMAVFSVGGNAGMACGTIFMTALLTLPGELINTPYFCLPGIVTAVLLWLNLPVISPAAPAGGAAATRKGDAARPLPYFLLTVLLSFIFIRSCIHAGLTTYIPLYYVHYLSGSPAFASSLLSIFLLAGVVGTYVGGTLSDKYGRKTVIMGSMLISWPLVALFPFTSGLTTLVLVAVTGFVLIATFSPLVVLAQEMMPGYEALAAGLTIGFTVGLGGIGATGLGYIADYLGVPAVFTTIAFLPPLTVLLATRLPGKLFKRDQPAK